MKRTWPIALLTCFVLLVACRPKVTGLPTLTPTLSVAAPTATSTLVLPSPTPTVVYHVIGAGEALSAIAVRYGVSVEDLAAANGIEDPNVIQEGQKLVIPGPTPEPTMTVVPTPTPTPDIAPQLEIVDVIGRGAPSAETVIIVNLGRGVSFKEWSLRDAHGNAFIFPDLYLAPGGEVRVHTGKGEDSPLHLYWGLDVPVWGDETDMAVLADSRGVMHAAKPIE